MTEKLTIALGGDERALDYKDALHTYLVRTPVARVIDVGADREDPAGYPHVAVDAAELVASGEADRALIFCGTGLGVAISANTVPGIRAVTAHDPVSVDGAIKINNAQVLTMGALIVGLGLAHTLVDQWLDLRDVPDPPGLPWWAPWTSTSGSTAQFPAEMCPRPRSGSDGSSRQANGPGATRVVGEPTSRQRLGGCAGAAPPSPGQRGAGVRTATAACRVWSAQRRSCV